MPRAAGMRYEPIFAVSGVRVLDEAPWTVPPRLTAPV